MEGSGFVEVEWLGFTDFNTSKLTAGALFMAQKP
jgi:hypothetical protein